MSTPDAASPKYGEKGEGAGGSEKGDMWRLELGPDLEIGERMEAGQGGRPGGRPVILMLRLVSGLGPSW